MAKVRRSWLRTVVGENDYHYGKASCPAQHAKAEAPRCHLEASKDISVALELVSILACPVVPSAFAAGNSGGALDHVKQVLAERDDNETMGFTGSLRPIMRCISDVERGRRYRNVCRTACIGRMEWFITIAYGGLRLFVSILTAWCARVGTGAGADG